ncbi:2OG-Fe(II) oxygenase [Ichthyenterobacterium magnum]|uniref:Rps23 Pro-64 3,4-dihydroxylase Tpa1-like proline 4-hydroxylase n=1 Tax=Ichthyenterobacterium magnum TaxID=1230530 RepID=A0A420DUV5_9FLAO|nr:2OG-Fe(II) oxygenase [Ichthyenterobacterium magnum]RKE98104.1 Rps23 Pro-64 3,4-dihydroxylase Tpa1-like proline 4-hydroxylase [Ichthyenterobacterium magnum]
MTKEEIIDHIYNSIKNRIRTIQDMYENSLSTIGYFYIDDLLPDDIAKKCFEVFPDKTEMRSLKSIREYKYVSAQMDAHHKLLEDVIYAFQDKKIVKLIGEICNVESLYADESLYAGGISLMAKDNFLHPHLDNSHDAERERWRVFNLLYYVTPDWETKNGGHLELWPNGPKKEPLVLESKFNRLAVMATHDASWHSVNKVTVDKSRCCISNYYFSDMPLKETDKFHVTKFRGRPNDTLTNLVLDIDASLRMLLRKIFKKGIRKNPHIYKKSTK